LSIFRIRDEQPAAAHRGSLPDVQPGGCGQQRPEFAWAFRQFQRTAHPVNFNLSLLAAGISYHVSPLSPPFAARQRPGGVEYFPLERLPGAGCVTGQEAPDAPVGGDGDVGGAGLRDEPVIADYPQRG